MARASDHTFRGIGGTAAGVLAAGAVLALMVYITGGWPRAWVDVVPGALIAAIAFLAAVTTTAWVNAVHGRADAARDACLRERTCPACGYRIGDIPAQVGGCTECPECGAAWRLSPRAPG